jgi:ribonuclease G
MQSAFVDIGLERTAFLHVSDAMQWDEYYDMFPDEIPFELERNIKHKKKSRPYIEDILKEGQEIMVQIIRSGIGTKGPRVTSWITLPGKYLVMMPFDEHIGVSRKIENPQLRARLRKLLEGFRGSDYGFIARTASIHATQTDIVSDMKFLVKLWEDIISKMNSAKGISMIHRELPLYLKVIRDQMAEDVMEVVIDSEKEFYEIKDFVSKFMPGRESQIIYYSERTPIFQHYGIEPVFDEIFSKVVWLKSGGFIQIDEMEALTSVDVNTGKYVGKRNLEDTIFKTNMESVKEIAYQLRLRNIGGIVVIDFIDMENEKNKHKVVDSLVETLSKDRMPATVLGMSEIGLVELTRKRSSRSMVKLLSEPCFYCEGKGFLKSRLTIAYEIFRNIEERAARITKAKSDNKRVFEIIAHPSVSDLILEEERQYVEEIEKKYNIKIVVSRNPEYHMEMYEIIER